MGGRAEIALRRARQSSREKFLRQAVALVGESSEVPATTTRPAKGYRSKQVDVLTVRSLVRQLPLGRPSHQYYFCEARECDVVYFPFDPQAPIFRLYIFRHCSESL